MYFYTNEIWCLRLFNTVANGNIQETGFGNDGRVPCTKMFGRYSFKESGISRIIDNLVQFYRETYNRKNKTRKHEPAN